MRTLRHEVDRRRDGVVLFRNYFIYDENINYLVKAQSYFTKEGKKLAKLNHKANARKK